MTAPLYVVMLGGVSMLIAALLVTRVQDAGEARAMQEMATAAA